MKNRTYTSLKKLYRLTINATGEKKDLFVRSIRLFIIAYIAQGIVFAMFYPLIKQMFSPNSNKKQVTIIFGAMIIVGMVSLIAKWKAHDFDFSGNIVDIAHNLRTRLGESLREMPLETLTAFKTGELNAIFSNNVEESVVAMGIVTSMIIELIFVPITITVITMFIDWRLALFMIVIFPLALPLYHKIRNINISEKSDLSSANAELESRFIEYVQGLPVLRAVNRAGANEEKLQSSIDNVRRIQASGLSKTQLPYVALGLMIQGVLLLLLFFGASFVLGNILELLILASCLLIVARLVEPMSLFVSIINIFEITDIALNNVNDILNIKALDTLTPIECSQGHEIQFDKVDFSYSGQNYKTIKNVSFHIREKNMTAIVGHSGCGKTTLTKLLMRYADIQHGSIRIGGADIRHMSQAELMKHISVVFQDVYLFDDTVMNNIRMNNPNATDEEVYAAAKDAHCDDFIDRLQEGYDTTIGDIGGTLSGGERQRISIARAILKKAPIVILDEPTAALDTESEVSVQQAIDKLVEYKTVIIIAHRLSTIVGADQILVMDNGEIIEKGKHHELMALEGKYYKMWSAQQRVKPWSVIV
jgi:ATP-binding cassette subfamily B protein